MAFQRYASQLLQSTPSAQAEPLFYSTYDFANEEDNALGQSDERPHSFAQSTLQSSETRGLHSDLTQSRQIPLPASNLWTTVNNTLSQGWRAHRSKSNFTPPIEDYSPTQSIFEEEELSPPSFLSNLPELDALTEPLIRPTTLYIYPSSAKGVSQRVELRKYRNSTWIVLYGLALLVVIALALKQLFIAPNTSKLPPIPTLLPALPLLSLLALLSLIAGLASLAYLLVVKNAIRHLVFAALIGAPVLLVFVGFIGAIGSFGNDGIENARWKLAVRVFALVCFVAAALLAKTAFGKRKKVNRTIMVLELSSSIILLHPPLFLLCLSLSILSTILTLPFLLLLIRLLSPTAHLTHSHFSYSTLLALLVWLWTLSIIRGIQRVTVAGVVGAWFFDRHEPTHPTPVELTSSAFSRATGPSLGTVIASAFLVSTMQSIAFLARRTRQAIRSTSPPRILSPIELLSPLLGAIVGALEFYNGWVLCWCGLTGDELSTSARKAGELVRKNGTLGLVDNLLIKLILTTTSTTLALFAGIIAFLIVSSRNIDPDLVPLLAVLCVAIPFYIIRLCADILGDAGDTLFLAFNIDLDTVTDHCTKAAEAFGEPDGDSLP